MDGEGLVAAVADKVGHVWGRCTSANRVDKEEDMNAQERMSSAFLSDPQKSLGIVSRTTAFTYDSTYSRTKRRQIQSRFTLKQTSSPTSYGVDIYSANFGFARTFAAASTAP